MGHTDNAADELARAADSLQPDSMGEAVDTARDAAAILLGFDLNAVKAALSEVQGGISHAIEHITRAGSQYQPFIDGDDRALQPAASRLGDAQNMMEGIAERVQAIGRELADLADRMEPAVNEHLAKYADLMSAARELRPGS